MHPSRTLTAATKGKCYELVHTILYDNTVDKTGSSQQHYQLEDVTLLILAHDVRHAVRVRRVDFTTVLFDHLTKQKQNKNINKCL